MSTRNFIFIIKNSKGKFTGYECYASLDYNRLSDYRKYGIKIFEAKSAEEAIKKAQKEYTEYGYKFVNL